jgi:integrase
MKPVTVPTRVIRRRSGWIVKAKGTGKRIIWKIIYFDVDGRRRKETTDAATKQVARRILAERQNAVEQTRLQKLGSVHELVALTWADVRFAERSIVVRRSKNGSFRVVPMSETLYQVLQRMLRAVFNGEPSPYVFTNADTGTPFARFNNTLWRAVLRHAGIKNFRWHALRHTFWSRLTQAGEPLLAIKELMGHKSITVTMRYTHLAPANLRSSVLALDRFAMKMGESATHSVTRSLEIRSVSMA